MRAHQRRITPALARPEPPQMKTTLDGLIRHGLSAFAVLAAVPFVHAQTTFTLLPALAGSSDMSPQGISGDGSTVVSISGNTAVKWTAAGGTVAVDAGILNPSGAHGISANGDYIVGAYTTAGNATHAFRWSSSSGPVDLGANSHAASAVSADGSVVVGTTAGSSFGNAYRWTAGTGVQILQGLSGYAQANDISSDGSVIVGAYQPTYGTSDSRAFRWTAGTGMVSLGTIAGAGGPFSLATAVSADGAVIVGTSDSAIGQQAFRWTTSTGMQGLGLLSNAITTAIAVSSNGNVIVGYAQVGGQQDYRAFRWDATSGIQYIADILQGAGVDLTGISLTNAVGISSDGSTIVGQGSAHGNSAGWLVHISPIPEPSTYAAILSAAAFGFAAWQKKRRTCQADAKHATVA